LKQQNPVGFARAKEENRGNGEAYPEGFTIDVTLADGAHPHLPVSVHVDLTSDPKAET
jgi:hypothetical protein